jgi:hypothetical protein
MGLEEAFNLSYGTGSFIINVNIILWAHENYPYLFFGTCAIN